MSDRTPDASAKPLGPDGDVRMVQAVKAVEAILPGYAIALVVAPFGAKPGRRANYIGNGNRSDILVLLKEVLARWEGRHQQAPQRMQ